jgi:hypothetical protein
VDIDTHHATTCQHSIGMSEARNQINTLLNGLEPRNENIRITQLGMESEIALIWKALSPTVETINGILYARLALETRNGSSNRVRKSAVENAVLALIQHYHNNPLQGISDMAVMTRRRIVHTIRNMVKQWANALQPGNANVNTDIGEFTAKQHISFDIQKAIRLRTGVTHSINTDALNRAACFETWTTTNPTELLVGSSSVNPLLATCAYHLLSTVHTRTRKNWL